MELLFFDDSFYHILNPEIFWNHYSNIQDYILDGISRKTPYLCSKDSLFQHIEPPIEIKIHNHPDLTFIILDDPLTNSLLCH